MNIIVTYWNPANCKQEVMTMPNINEYNSNYSDDFMAFDSKEDKKRYIVRRNNVLLIEEENVDFG